MKLDPESLVVESFDPNQATPAYAAEPTSDQAADKSQYCTWYNTCETCWTDCPCA